MPAVIESELNKQICKFTWNHERVDTVNQAQMYVPHQHGGKKILDIEARNKVTHLMWLQTYLNMGEERATWTYFADAIIGVDIRPSLQIDEDPGSRVMPILQTWETRARNSMLPEDLKTMLKLAREYNVRISAANPMKEVREELPLWYHTKSDPSARKLYRTKVARCLRGTHGVKLVKDATALLGGVGENHTPVLNCTCMTCTNLRTVVKCTHPGKCITMLATLLGKIHPAWNPATQGQVNGNPERGGEETTDPLDRKVERGDETTRLTDTIMIFGETEEKSDPRQEERPEGPRSQTNMATVYMDGACINNGGEEAQAGCGIWYGEDDPRNTGERVPHRVQTNQTRELTAVLLAVKRHNPTKDLRIISDSKYVIDRLTTNLRRWEKRGWVDVSHGDLFKTIVAWTRQQTGDTYV